MSVSLIFRVERRKFLNVSTAAATAAAKATQEREEHHQEENSHFGVSTLNFIPNMWCWCHKNETFSLFSQFSSTTQRIDRNEGETQKSLSVFEAILISEPTKPAFEKSRRHRNHLRGLIEKNF
jgi:hypothetical protein